MRSRFCHEFLLKISILLTIINAQCYAAQMSTPGNFSVGKEGNAQYSIPIQIRGNFGGIAPNIELKYDSKNANSNGMVGLGWSLSGFSSINRCAKTIAQDGVSAPVLDAVPGALSLTPCLDGQRLVQNNTISAGTDNTVYGTELEDFSLIIGYSQSLSNPVVNNTQFTIRSKKRIIKNYNQIRMYGQEDNAYSVNVSWPITTIFDNFMNLISFQYTLDQANLDIYPAAITYTPHGANSQTLAEFVFDTRPDAVTSYREGSSIREVKRLSKIQTYSGSGSTLALLKEYRLTYEQEPTTQRSRLISITECDGKSVCLPPTTIVYSSTSQVQFDTTFQSDVIDWGLDFGRGWVDANGDGKVDFCRLIGNIGAYKLACTMSNGNSFGITTTSSILDPGIDVSRKWVDVNGDGLADFCRITGTTGFYQLTCTLSTPSGFGDTVSSSIDPGNEMGNALWFDSHSDGRMRYCRFSGTTDFKCALLQGTTFVDEFAGGKGSGKFDLVDIVGGGLIYRCGQYPGLTSCISLAGRLPNFSSAVIDGTGWWADINGDGKSDYCKISPDNTVNSTIICSHALGVSNTDSSILRFEAYPTIYSDSMDLGLPIGRKWIDINRDSHLDYCRVIGSTGLYKLACTLSAENSFGSTITSNAIDKGLDAGSDWVDVKGTGEEAYCRVIGTANLQDSRIACTPIIVGTNVVTKIIDGLGLNTSIDYAPITDANIYTKDNNSIYPISDIVVPYYVVSSVAVDDAAGGSRHFSYKYGGLKFDNSGRGSLGFRWEQSTDMETGIISRSDYLQNWPYTGLLSSTTNTLPNSGNNGLLNSTTYISGCNDFVSQSGCAVGVGKRYFPFLSQKNTLNWDLDGTTLPSISIAAQYDNWGNEIQTNYLSSDGFSAIVNTTYANSATPWLAEPTKSVIVKTSP